MIHCGILILETINSLKKENTDEKIICDRSFALFEKSNGE